MLIFNKNALRNKLQHYRQNLRRLKDRLRKDDGVMSANEKADLASKESFPASDPPGHISKTTEDKNLH
jgi:hypothetical protein